MKINIYVLKDPITKEVRYVGCSKNIKQRYNAHINKCRDLKTKKRKWLEGLRIKGLKPILEIIETVDDSTYLIKEKYYIDKYRKEGCNLTNTGYLGFNGNSTSFKGENTVSVVALLLDGTFYNSYDSVTLAAIENQTSISNISSVLSNKTKTASNLIWVTEENYYNLTEDDINFLVLKANDNSNKGNKSTQFSKGHKVWNKGLKGVKLKPNKNVYQYSALTGEYIKKWETAKEAGIALSINIESIGQCARKVNKTAGGYIWRYIKEDNIEPIKYKGKTSNNIKNKLK